uniref:Ig-like domain-containing protein n=1 Tax=Cyanoderma ruficeps TaxID=181631 RepID=A0A8C3R790_9PASS
SAFPTTLLPSPYLILPGLQGQTSVAQRRREGDTAYIKCPYTPQTQFGYIKFWCIQRDGQWKQLVSTYSGRREQSNDNRITIEDDAIDKTVSITITDLKAEDSGTYSCAIYINKFVPLRTISLTVFKELLKWELDTLSVQCPFRYGMAWCRREQTGCTVLAERQTSRRSAVKSLRDRASITYDTADALTVTMEKLQTSDSGVYWCAQGSGRTQVHREVVLSVFKSEYLPCSQCPGSSGNTLIILSVVLFILLLLALLTSAALGVRHYKLLRRAVMLPRAFPFSPQPGSTGRRGSSQEDSKGLAYINLGVQSQPSPEDPLYCNVESSQAHRSPQHVEYAVIAFNQSPRSGRE